MFDTIAADLVKAAGRLEDSAPFTPRGVSEKTMRDLAGDLRKHALAIASLGSHALRHTSYHEQRRNEHNPRERVFAELWEQQNDAKRMSTGVLLALLTKDVVNDLYSRRDREWIDTPMTTRDMRVAATVVQWLGSNVGMGFLEEALRACGYQLTQEKPAADFPCPHCGRKYAIAYYGGKARCCEECPGGV